MTKVPSPKLKRDDVYIRAFAIMAAGVLLNIGLFFLLGVLTSLFVGLIVGYIIGERGIGPLASTLSSLLAYSIMFFVTSSSYDMLSIIGAVLIMALIGGFGGHLGYYIRMKSVSSQN